MGLDRQDQKMATAGLLPDIGARGFFLVETGPCLVGSVAASLPPQPPPAHNCDNLFSVQT